jgi:hypothetical protein
MKDETIAMHWQPMFSHKTLDACEDIAAAVNASLVLAKQFLEKVFPIFLTNP